MKHPALLFAAAMLAMAELRGQTIGGSIEAPEGARVLMQAKGDGVQVYTCTETQNVRKWVLKGPEAKLLDLRGKVIGTHFAGPTWKLSDGGIVQGEVVASKPAPDPGSVAWLLLRAKPGTASGSLGSITFIRRTETQGGVASAAGCQDAGDIGKTVEVPYSATYTFYAAK